MIVWFPPESVLVDGLVADPPASATGPPKSAPSMRNCTVPVGVPAPGEAAATVAVNVTACPAVAGLAEEVSDAVVALRATAIACGR